MPWFPSDRTQNGFLLRCVPQLYRTRCIHTHTVLLGPFHAEIFIWKFYFESLNFAIISNVNSPLSKWISFEFFFHNIHHVLFCGSFHTENCLSRYCLNFEREKFPVWKGPYIICRLCLDFFWVVASLSVSSHNSKTTRPRSSRRLWLGPHLTALRYVKYFRFCKWRYFLYHGSMGRNQARCYTLKFAVW